MIGPFVNAGCTLAGGAIGTALRNLIHPESRARLTLVLGLAAMGMGVSMAARLHALPPVILALLVGAIIGEILSLEQRLGGLSSHLRGAVDRWFPTLHGPGPQGLDHAAHTERLVAAMVLFVASGTGIFGAMREGITGDPTILLVKAGLDGITAAIFAADLGLPVALIALPQLLVQLALLGLGCFVMPLVSPEMVADFSGLGGMMMIATGLRICGIAPFPVANLLPALVLALPVSAAFG